MALIQWEDKYSVGVSDLDSQHQLLVELINKIHDAMKMGKSKEVVPGVLKDLVKYTQEHFAYEENYMAKIGYIDLAQHKVQHAHFIKKIVNFQNDFESGKVGINFEIINFLKDWLLGHICISDQKYMR